MAITHDGVQQPLPPSRLWQLVGLGVLVGGIALVLQGGGLACLGSVAALFGLLTVGNQLGGVTRVRVTFSKLLVEHERPVVGFLIGPVKQRIPWEELLDVVVEGGEVVAKGRSTTLQLAKGHSGPELEELARKIRDAAARHRAEGGQ